MAYPNSRFLAALPLAFVALAAIGCGQTIGDPAPSAAADKIREALAKSGGSGGPAVAALPTQTWKEEMGRITIKGSIKAQGMVTLPALNADKDPGVCVQPPNQAFVVDAAGNVQYAVVYIDGIQDDWCEASMKPGKTDPVLFDQKQCIFLSHVLAAQKTQPVTFRNSDSVPHNAKFQPENNKPDNFTVAPGASTPYSYTDQEVRPFNVVCGVHTWMSSWILTRDNGYFAVTGPNGEFTIPHVPAGITLQCKVWQEKTGFLRETTLATKPAEGKWTGPTLELKLEKGKDLNLQFVIDASKVK